MIVLNAMTRKRVLLMGTIVDFTNGMVYAFIYVMTWIGEIIRRRTTDDGKRKCMDPLIKNPCKGCHLKIKCGRIVVNKKYS